MPEVVDNIGNWMGALETLSNLSVVTNMVLLYYTHKNFQTIFTIGDQQITNDLNINAGLQMVEFLLILFTAEHILMAIKAFIGFVYGNTPEKVSHGLQERKELLD